ncbi:hypothetical protein A3860_05650 [Niastella vici]|uniref:Iron dicitrate transport regulator FecR n=1 Tax=Niastella vici TaxID=1703345 RepID=A0A1V9FSH4_9BACT|nr:FecR family protein [Niastella vici]OQP61196.1 hypothetical protein A3860_05650 [Niastella vici]
MASSLEYLLNRYADKTCTPEEKEELMRQLQEGGNDEAMQQVIDKMIEERPAIHSMPDATAQAVLQAIFEADEAPVVPLETGRLRKISFGRIATTAVVLLLVTVAGWLLVTRTSNKQVATLTTNGDVAPGGNKALLTLSNRSTIVLDNAANGVVAHEGNAAVIKLKNGELKYTTADDQPANSSVEIAFNTLSTPKGGEYTVVLPDGTQVWLNAASSITYPTVFDAKERKVQITGEAYFEVAKLLSADGRKRVPFVVDILPATGRGTVGGRIEVLGTHFNVNAYNDEKAIKTTLLEGKVKVTKDEASAILKPGEQVSISHPDSYRDRSSHLSQPIPVQTDAVMAWKNGVFHFENADIKTVMRQLSRWYDVEVVYRRNPDTDDPLFFEVSRHTNLSDVLKVLNLAGGARYSIENKKIIVQ